VKARSYLREKVAALLRRKGPGIAERLPVSARNPVDLARQGERCRKAVQGLVRHIKRPQGSRMGLALCAGREKITEVSC
jgi:hypothetical protein